MTIDRVPLLDLRRQGPDIDAELVAAFQRVLRSGHYILGPEVEAFERQCAEYIGVKHAIGVSSGTDALLLALMALDIGAGHEVICPTYTFFATAGTVWRTGARPVFADITPCCYNMVGDIAKLITPRTRAIIPVHLYGQSAELRPLLALAKEHRLAVIEDAAQALGARYGDLAAGASGTFGCFSFFPSKNIGALGDAGLLVTNDDALAERARVMRIHGGKPKYHHQVVGGNFRIDALQAALLRVKMKYAEVATRARQRNAALYTELFMKSGVAGPCVAESCTGRWMDQRPDARVLLPVECQAKHIYNQYVVRIVGEGRRDSLRSFLASRNIGTEVYYPVPMHMQECFASLGVRPGSFPPSEAAARETIALPIFPELKAEEIAYVVDGVVAHVRS